LAFLSFFWFTFALCRERRVTHLAREASRWLDEVTRDHHDPLPTSDPAVILQKPSEMASSCPLPTNSVGDVADNRVLDYCLFLRGVVCGLPILLTNDRNLALKARAAEVRVGQSVFRNKIRSVSKHGRLRNPEGKKRNIPVPVFFKTIPFTL